MVSTAAKGSMPGLWCGSGSGFSGVTPTYTAWLGRRKGAAVGYPPPPPRHQEIHRRIGCCSLAGRDHRNYQLRGGGDE